MGEISERFLPAQHLAFRYRRASFEFMQALEAMTQSLESELKAAVTWLRAPKTPLNSAEEESSRGSEMVAAATIRGEKRERERQRLAKMRDDYMFFMFEQLERQLVTDQLASQVFNLIF